MPPSGFSEKHTKHLSAFCVGCLDDLINENLGRRTAIPALIREIGHIDNDLAQHNDRSSAAQATLELIGAFYKKTLIHLHKKPRLEIIADRELDFLKAAGITAAREICDEVEAIHIDEDAEPSADIQVGRNDMDHAG